MAALLSVAVLALLTYVTSALRVARSVTFVSKANSVLLVAPNDDVVDAASALTVPDSVAVAALAACWACSSVVPAWATTCADSAACADVSAVMICAADSCRATTLAVSNNET